MRAASLLLLLFLATNLLAQDPLDDITAKTCECFRTIDTTLTTDERNMVVGICMLQSAEPYKKELKKRYKLDFSRLDESAEELGRLVGFKMAVKCPDQLARFVRAQNQSADEPPPVAPPAPATATRPITLLTVPGKLASVRTGQFLTLVVLAEDGRTLDLLLLGQATGVANLLRRTDQGRGATGMWSYSVDELFDPASRTFRPYYVISGFAAQ